MQLTKSRLISTVYILIRSFGAFLLLLLAIILVQVAIALLGYAFTRSTVSAEQMLFERTYPIVLGLIIIWWTQKKTNGIYNRIRKGLTINTINFKLFIYYLIISLVFFYIFF